MLWQHIANKPGIGIKTTVLDTAKAIVLKSKPIAPVAPSNPLALIGGALVSQIGSFLKLADLNRMELVDKASFVAIRDTYPALRTLSWTETPNMAPVADGRR